MKISGWMEEKEIHNAHPLKKHSMSPTFIRSQKIPMEEGGETHVHRQLHFIGPSTCGRRYCVVHISAMAWFEWKDGI